MAFDFHAQHNNAASATALTEAHNNYVQQLHAANGMIDQYYRETLPELLQVGQYVVPFVLQMAWLTSIFRETLPELLQVKVS